MIPDGEERVARAALMHLAEPGDRMIGELVETHGAAALLAAIRDGSLTSPRAGHYRARLPTLDTDRDFRRCDASGARLVCPGDPEWPTQLDDLGYRRPLGLWVRGDVDLRVAAARSVAVVGSRSSTCYGEGVAAELAASLAESGWTVVSGGAFGIDAAAHRGALAVSGPTMVVLASGVDIPYPRSNEALLQRIADEGAVLSEVPPGRPAARHRFLERNRVIAALTRGTVVVEAAFRSGALNTARTADELGRQVMGVPGPVTSTMSAGVHQLIRERGAVLVNDAADVIEQVGAIGDDLAPPRRGPVDARDRLDPTTAKVLDAVPPRRAVQEDFVARTAGVDPEHVMRSLAVLEITGWVTRTAAGWRLKGDARDAVLDLDPGG